MLTFEGLQVHDFCRVLEFATEVSMRSTKELLGARIREVRKGAKLSQEQLAEKVDVDPRYISRIELGKCFPSLETLEGSH